MAELNLLPNPSIDSISTSSSFTTLLLDDLVRYLVVPPPKSFNSLLIKQQASLGLTGCMLPRFFSEVDLLFWSSDRYLLISSCSFLIFDCFLFKSSCLPSSLNSFKISSLLQNILFSLRYRIEVRLLQKSVTEQLPPNFFLGISNMDFLYIEQFGEYFLTIFLLALL